jgi:hypothetical protein
MALFMTADPTLSPDPWGPEIETVIQDPDTLALCHRCLTPHEHEAWFCPVCGTAVGKYNNYMPFVCLFSVGEVLRAGVTDYVRPSFLNIIWHLFFSFCNYLIFAPIYWYFFLRNVKDHSARTSGKQ